MSFFKRIVLIVLVLLMFSGMALAFAAEPVTLKVACVGDSLTFGTGTDNPQTESWPSVLAAASGPLELETYNFGVYGRTVTNSPFFGYTNTASYYQSLNADADVYLVMLGSNDLLSFNWRETLPQQYRELLQTYMSLPQQPQVIVLLPPDMYYEDRYSYLNAAVYELRDLEESIARELGLDVIDLSEISGGMAEYCIDGGHYNSEGYDLFGSYIYEKLCLLLKRGRLSAL